MRVCISAKRLVIPRVCACCGEPAELEVPFRATRTWGKRVHHSETRSWDLPYCSECIAHVRAWPDHSGCLYALLYMATLGIYVIIDYSFVIPGQQREVVATMCKPTCARGHWAATFVGWDGTTQVFDLASDSFAVAFAQANSDKLVNVEPRLRELLKARLIDAMAEKAREVESLRADLARQQERDLYTGTVVKLESAKGPASRRAVLERALASIESAELRERLMREAARIEVAAILDKVDGLKSATAKRRHLQAAIDGLRADTVPDHLQAAEIRMLEDALAEVE